ncbi:hypothetical protein GPECTOR_3g417 [Gonium pectorale]|uniref:Protein kinase domain-containing protein n=1 Tax=Gonium pectorale TaxID=33097 RepID=A0A150H138_GONPE|nr:hypothetical protein GPECTOR_3g417 [Gonium pectorale]|eukprot:KXZ55280.1 hypothetical protein GPECTOR_3g417 [Gonium pectorale]
MSVRALLNSGDLLSGQQASRTISAASTLPVTDEWLRGLGGEGAASSSKSLQNASGTRAMPALIPGQLKLDFNDLVFIGQGATGLVYRGTATGAAPGSDGTWDSAPSAAVTVAVKFMICNTPRQLWQRAKEALLSKLVSHPNLVRTLAMDVTLVTPNTYHEWGAQRAPPAADASGAPSTAAGGASMDAETVSYSPHSSAERGSAKAYAGAHSSAEHSGHRIPKRPDTGTGTAGTASLPAPAPPPHTSAPAGGYGRCGPQASGLSHPQVERLRGAGHGPAHTTGELRRAGHERMLNEAMSGAGSPVATSTSAGAPSGTVSLGHMPAVQPEQQSSWPGPDGYLAAHRPSNLGVKALSGSPWTTADGTGEPPHGHTADGLHLLPLSAMGLTVGAPMETNAANAASAVGVAAPAPLGRPGMGMAAAAAAAVVTAQQQRRRRRKRALQAVSAALVAGPGALEALGSPSQGGGAAGPDRPESTSVGASSSVGPYESPTGGGEFGTPVDMAALPASALQSGMTERRMVGAPSSASVSRGGLATASLLSPLLTAASNGAGDFSREESLANVGGVVAPAGLRARGGCADTSDGSCRNGETVPFQDILYHLDALPGRFLAKVIMEYCDSGTLLERINAGDFNTHPDRGALAMLSAMRALLWCLQQVVDGMEHLHSLNIIHGDLKPANVLLASQPGSPLGYVSKVSDFGLATALEASEQTITHENWGTVLYMAPESCAGRCRKASDVYSFGVLLWQMVTGERPYAGLQAGQVLLGVKTGTLKLQWPPWVNKSLSKVGQACLRFEPKERPGFKGIRSALSKIGARLDEKIAVVESVGLRDSRVLGPSTGNVPHLPPSACAVEAGGSAEEEAGAATAAKPPSGGGGGGGGARGAARRGGDGGGMARAGGTRGAGICEVTEVDPGEGN